MVSVFQSVPGPFWYLYPPNETCRRGEVKWSDVEGRQALGDLQTEHLSHYETLALLNRLTPALGHTPQLLFRSPGAAPLVVLPKAAALADVEHLVPATFNRAGLLDTKLGLVEAYIAPVVYCPMPPANTGEATLQATKHTVGDRFRSLTTQMDMLELTFTTRQVAAMDDRTYPDGLREAYRAYGAGQHTAWSGTVLLRAFVDAYADGTEELHTDFAELVQTVPAIPVHVFDRILAQGRTSRDSMLALIGTDGRNLAAALANDIDNSGERALDGIDMTPILFMNLMQAAQNEPELQETILKTFPGLDTLTEAQQRWLYANAPGFNPRHLRFPTFPRFSVRTLRGFRAHSVVFALVEPGKYELLALSAPGEPSQMKYAGKRYTLPPGDPHAETAAMRKGDDIMLLRVTPVPGGLRVQPSYIDSDRLHEPLNDLPGQLLALFPIQAGEFSGFVIVTAKLVALYVPEEEIAVSLVHFKTLDGAYRRIKLAFYHPRGVALHFEDGSKKGYSVETRGAFELETPWEERPDRYVSLPFQHDAMLSMEPGKEASLVSPTGKVYETREWGSLFPEAPGTPQFSPDWRHWIARGPTREWKWVDM